MVVVSERVASDRPCDARCTPMPGQNRTQHSPLLALLFLLRLRSSVHTLTLSLQHGGLRVNAVQSNPSPHVPIRLGSWASVASLSGTALRNANGSGRRAKEKAPYSQARCTCHSAQPASTPVCTNTFSNMCACACVYAARLSTRIAVTRTKEAPFGMLVGPSSHTKEGGSILTYTLGKDEIRRCHGASAAHGSSSRHGSLGASRGDHRS